MSQATIKLFKALPIKVKRKKSPTLELLKKTIKRGFVFSPEVLANYSNYDELIKLVEEVFGITSEKVNTTFHKSWKKVKEADIEQLVVEQIAHYLTTYGKKDPEGYMFQKEYLENWGVDNLSERISGLEDFHKDKIRDKGYIYIPKEILDIPEIEVDEIKLVVIKGYTRQELKDKLLKLLNSGIALKEDTINDVVDVAIFLNLKGEEIETIKNKETKVILYGYLDIFPESPVEFLRFIVYEITGKTLLIKSKEMIEEIRDKKKKIRIIKLFKDYEKQYGLEKLASIFYRFRLIFLAIRHIGKG